MEACFPIVIRSLDIQWLTITQTLLRGERAYIGKVRLNELLQAVSRNGRKAKPNLFKMQDLFWNPCGRGDLCSHRHRIVTAVFHELGYADRPIPEHVCVASKFVIVPAVNYSLGDRDFDKSLLPLQPFHFPFLNGSQVQRSRIVCPG